MSEPLLVIGNGMAAARFVDELATHALGRYAVAVIGEEPRLAYNRVLLSSLLANEVSSDEIELKTSAWWRDRGVTLRYGCAATAVDVADRTVTLADRTRMRFSKLVFATGSRAVRLPVPGMQLGGVLTFRGAADVEAIAASAAKDARIVVIGGGLLGLEAAYGLAKKGASVTLVHLMDRLMERQLDQRAADMLRHAIEMKGVTVVLDATTRRFVGETRVEAVELADGRLLPADAVVVAVGIRANAELARDAGLEVNRGIVVDDGLQTSRAGIFAIGECAEHRGQCCGLVEPAYEQGAVLARRLADEEAHYEGSAPATNLKVSGVNVFSAGDVFRDSDADQIVLTDPGAGAYKKLVLSNGRLVGAVLFGDTTDGLWYLDLIRSGRAIEPLRDGLVFGRAVAEPALS